MRHRWTAHADHQPASRRRADKLRPVQGDAEQRSGAAGAVRRPGEGGDRTRLGRFVHRSADLVPGAAHRRHRHRAELDRGDDADRGPVATVAAVGDGTSDPPARTAADQRAVGAEGATARRTERRGGAQEPGNRAGTRRAGRAGDGARADVEVQVRVPGEHVARAAHAVELDPDPWPAAWRQPGRQPDAASGRIRAHHPRRGHRPAEPDQRHPRSVEDRIRHDVGGCRGNPAA